MSGSLPHGAPPTALADVVRTAHAHATPVVVDTSGAALADALAARPTLVKPNADELAELTGERDPLVAATAARRCTPRQRRCLPRRGRAHRRVDRTGAGAPGRPVRSRQSHRGGRRAGGRPGPRTGARRGTAAAARRLRRVVGGRRAAAPYAGEVDPARGAAQRAGIGRPSRQGVAR